LPPLFVAATSSSRPTLLLLLLSDLEALTSAVLTFNGRDGPVSKQYTTIQQFLYKFAEFHQQINSKVDTGNVPAQSMSSETAAAVSMGTDNPPSIHLAAASTK
jgi:hypothetical protein